MLTVAGRASASGEGPANSSSSLHSHWFSPGARTEHGQVRNLLIQKEQFPSVCVHLPRVGGQLRESSLLYKELIVLGLSSDLNGHLKVLLLPLSSVTQVTSVELVTCKALLLNITCGGMCPYVVVQCLEDETSSSI